MIVLTDVQIQEIINNLRGTTGSLDLQIESIIGDGHDAGDIDPVCLDQIDSDIFLCNACGWWCDKDEEAEDEWGTCEECSEDFTEYEDGESEEDTEDGVKFNG